MVGDRNLEEKVREERAHTPAAAYLPWVPRQREVPAAARKFELPLSRFPLRGQAGAGGFPPRRKHAARQQTALARIDAAGSPHKRGCRPLVDPPLASRIDGLAPEALGGDDRTRQKNKDGRHVGLDFYDLLIEAV